MGRLAALDPAPQNGGREQKRETVRILKLQGEVDPDGLAATFDVAYTDSQPLRVRIPYGEINGVISELETAAKTMQERRRLARGSPAQDALRLCRAVSKPSAIQITVDQATQDRIFTLSFRDRAPISFAIPAMKLPFYLAQLAMILRRSRH